MKFGIGNFYEQTIWGRKKNYLPKNKVLHLFCVFEFESTIFK
jgi:hypothetical protein